MDINHPLYSTLKDYYINLDSNIDNTLIIQYIEDTCDIDDYIKFKDDCSKCRVGGVDIKDEIYFCYTKKEYSLKFRKTMTIFYCYFTNKVIYENFCKYVNYEKNIQKLNKYTYHFDYNNNINYIIITM